MLVGKIVGVYGKLLKYSRDFAPFMVQGATKFFNFGGFNTTAHNLTYGRKIMQAGNPLGLNMSNFSIKNGIFADIRRIDKNLKTGIVKGFKELPNNITKSIGALKNWVSTSIKAMPANFINGLKAFKTGFLNIPNMIRNAIVAFRAFSATLLTSPIGWIALAIGVVALVIYKYWKPITAFFKGMWKGLKEGLQPLMPLFKRMAVALEPIIKPIRAIIDWFKKLIKPVEDTGGAAENMGVKFGKAIAGIIVKFVELITKAFECGAKITSMLAAGIMKGIAKVKDCIAKVSQVIRDHLPHSPAKTGPLKDLHKVKIVETIASTIKPMPLQAAMNKTLGVFSGGLKTNVRGVKSSAPAQFVINYNPTINCSGNTTKDEFAQMLKKHKDEILRIFKNEADRKLRVAY